MTRNSARLVILLSSAFGGTVYVCSKLAFSEIGPFSLTATRFLVSGLILLCACGATGTKISKSALTDSIVPALAFTLGFLLLFAGLRTATSSIAAFLANSDAFLIPVVDWILFRRKIGKKTFQALAAGSIGLLLLSIRPDLRIAREDLLILASATFFAIFYSVNQSVVKRHSPLVLTTITQLICGFVALPFALTLENYPRNLMGASAFVLLIVLYFCLVVSGFRFWMVMKAQEVLSASEVGVGFLLEPVLASVLGAMILGDQLRFIQWVGAGFILAALSWPFISHEKRTKQPVPPPTLAA